MNAGQSPVVVLGAGINGCAIARELLLNATSVWLVDAADISSGATSGSSRLIHGGLRYLEYGELDLVKESLGERTRLLRLAPQFVHPLRLWIPSATRFGGLTGAIGRFFGWRWWPQPVPENGRGIELVRAGLAVYDAYARDPLLPRHEVFKSAKVPLPVDHRKYRWLSSYYDAQVAFPERLALALLEDARQLATQQGLDFQVFNYHQATLRKDTVEIAAADGATTTVAVKPAAIVNATGAWVDETLERLHVPSARLMGGTKGSHLFTFNARLKDAIAGQGIYAEAHDGRPIFITPLANTVLIGTTDEPFEGPPEQAIATERELAYLLGAVNSILPDVQLTQDDVDFHYSAVRPLPYVHANSPAAITRRHAVVKHEQTSVPLFSVVGGKLTTMRSLAETTTATVLAAIGRPHTHNSAERSIPGGESYPPDTSAIRSACEQIARQCDLPRAAVWAVWQLCGTRTRSILDASTERELLPDADLPVAFIRWSIRQEWAVTLADLVERRLMLLYHQRLTRAGLVRLAELLVEEGRLPQAHAATAVSDEIARLASRFGKHVN